MGKMGAAFVVVMIALVVGKSVHTEDVNTEDVERRNTWTEYAKEATNTAYQKVASLSRTTSTGKEGESPLKQATNHDNEKMDKGSDTIVDTTLSTASGIGSYAKEKVGQAIGMVRDVDKEVPQKEPELLKGATKTDKLHQAVATPGKQEEL